MLSAIYLLSFSKRTLDYLEFGDIAQEILHRLVWVTRLGTHVVLSSLEICMAYVNHFTD